MKQHLKLFVLASVMTCSVMAYGADEEVVMERVGSWFNVSGFSISRNADYIVMSQREADGKELIYESYKTSDGWQVAEPIESINEMFSAGGSVGGLMLTADFRRIFFHAKKPGETETFDIYYVEKTNKGWSEPKRVEGVSSEVDDTYPSLVPGDETIYLLRHQVTSDVKLEKKEQDRKSIYRAQKDLKNNWKRATPINNTINTGFIQDVKVADDKQTVYYSVRTERKKPSEIMFTRLLLGDNWLIPRKALGENDGYDYFSPQCVNDELYFIKSNNKKQDGMGAIYVTSLNEEMSSFPTVAENGKVKKLGADKAVAADIVMFDPTSNAVIGRYKSDEWQGEYHLTGNADREYIVEVRSEGYSFDSYIVNYKDNARSQLPQTIELFDTIQLAVSVYDSEIFRPLESKVIAVRVSDKAIFRSKKIGEGYYLFSLPLGSNYNIIATSNKFAENKFLQKLEGDVIFSRFERQLPLVPTKRDVTVKVVDAKTGAPVAANVTLANLSREEQLFVDGAEMSNGVAKVKLREGDIYDLIVGGARRYSFHNRTLDMSKSTDTEFVVELTPLEAGASVRLNDIRFATASSDIMIESYEELDRVVTLLAENPTLRIEIAAHTDNVGNAKYNMKLSENRALSVLNYLVDSGVDESRLIAKGYGLTKPLVANDSEENKAINRRVEFKILAEE